MVAQIHRYLRAFLVSHRGLLDLFQRRFGDPGESLVGGGTPFLWKQSTPVVRARSRPPGQIQNSTLVQGGTVCKCVSVFPPDCSIRILSRKLLLLSDVIS